MSEVDELLVTNVRDTPDVRDYLAAVEARSPYALSFPVGPRGAALVNFGRAIVLECFVPYVIPASRKRLALMPLPLIGQVIHDLRETVVDPDDVELCLAGRCTCDSRPTG